MHFRAVADDAFKSEPFVKLPLQFDIGARQAQPLAGFLYLGTQFVDVAFITVVIGGGANPIIGALSSAALLAAISTPLSSVLGTFIGRIGLLVAALVVIRFLPRGLSGYWQELRYRRMGRASL